MPTDSELLAEIRTLQTGNIEDRAAIARLKDATSRLEPTQTSQKRANVERIAVLEANIRKRDRRLQDIKKGK